MGNVKFKFDKKAIEKAALDAAREKVSGMNFDIECPHCHAAVNVPAGVSICPACGNQINLKVNVGF